MHPVTQSGLSCRSAIGVLAANSLISNWVPRKLPLPRFFIDSNRINALGRDEHMNRLETWKDDGVIGLRLPEQAQVEIERAGNKQRKKVLNRLVPLDVITTEKERSTLLIIQSILSRDGCLSKNDRIDALIVFNVQKYLGILLTADRNLLNKAEKLRLAVGAQIMSAQDAVAFVRQEIHARDKAALSFAARYGLLAPAWVGSD
jgi:hypothetical protein